MSDPQALAEGLLSQADEDQVRMMEERVILVDWNDKAIGSGSKKETHIMASINEGLLHRAFSVFLFTPDGKLILQQRSGAKITFPYIWANTCCSHPLHVPSEMIEEDAAGVKNAARRKLEHELGIPPEDVPYDAFTWLTRVHYVGASVPEDGSPAVWGEHEIDWILMCTPPKMPRMELNVNEVAATHAFTQEELKAWMATRHERGEEVSPWFGCMEASGILYTWWDAVLARKLEPVMQRDVIHRQHELEARARGVPVADVPVQPALAASQRLATEKAALDAAEAVTEAAAAALAAAAVRGGAGAVAASSASASSSHLKASSVGVAAPTAASLASGRAGASSTTIASPARPSGVKVSGAAALAAATGSALSGAGAGAAAGGAATGASASAAAAAAAAAATAAAGGGASIPGASAAAPKQGAYGKVKIHSEPLLSQLSHPDEVVAALAFKLGFTKATVTPPLPADADESLRFCDAMLMRVSRSFAMVIQQLPPHLRASITVFYLVLRGLDTVEDDMEAFKGDAGAKLAHLRAFHTYLRDPAFAMSGVGEGDEATLLQRFGHVTACFLRLPAVDQEVIANVCARMGTGMAAFSGRDLREGTADEADYGLYCHYVAGLVGEGLSRLFVAHGDEAPIVAQDVKLADDMGRFLQKTNIIRDYLEDLVDGRAFWPRTVWGQYAPGLANLRAKVDAELAGGKPDAEAVASGAKADDGTAAAAAGLHGADAARACLNHLIADAMTLAPSCLRYMTRLRQRDVFRFCAIPQLMAIATLDKLADNADVFTGVVKIRKGQALQLMNLACGGADGAGAGAGAASGGGVSMVPVYEAFLKHARSIRSKVPRRHVAARAILDGAVAEVEAMCLAGLREAAAAPARDAQLIRPLFSPAAVVLATAVFLALVRHLYGRRSAWHAPERGSGGYLPRITDSADVAALAAAVALALYLALCAGVPVVMRLMHPGSERDGGSVSPPMPSSPASSPRSASASASAPLSGKGTGKGASGPVSRSAGAVAAGGASTR